MKRFLMIAVAVAATSLFAMSATTAEAGGPYRGHGGYHGGYHGGGYGGYRGGGYGGYHGGHGYHGRYNKPRAYYGHGYRYQYRPSYGPSCGPAYGHGYYRGGPRFSFGFAF